jgi:glycosyltransferase involved in cell wall biosynthesis
VVPEGRLGEDARRSGIPVSTLGIESKLTGVRSLPRLLRQVGTTDVLHSHMFHANMLARLARPVLRTRAVVSTIHNVYESAAAYRNPQQKTTRNRLYGLTDRCADRTTCVCRTARDRYVDLGVVDSDRTTVVYNGIDGSEFRPDTAIRQRLRSRHGADGAFVWLAVGRFYEMKDYPNLLRAFARTAEEDAILWIVGHGDGQVAAKRLAADLCINDRVRFLGVVDDVAPIMQAADGFVLASRWEGFPMVLLEAEASGLPVVATRAGGVPELVQNRRTGLLAPVEDADALAGAMDDLVGMDTDGRRALGRAGREWTIERFGIETIVDRWVALYRDLLSS